jgi:peroxiredoxin
MKKILFSLLLVLIAAATMYYFVSTDRAPAGQPAPPPPVAATEEKAAPPPVPVQNDLPDMPLLKTDGTQLTARSLAGKVILVFFLPDCDHCQREARQISNRLDAFKEYPLYFVSTAPLPQLEQFAREYNLAGQPNVFFAQTTPEELYRHYGLFPTPTLYIYREGGRLEKVFRNETPVETIISAL